MCEEKKYALVTLCYGARLLSIAVSCRNLNLRWSLQVVFSLVVAEEGVGMEVKWCQTGTSKQW